MPIPDKGKLHEAALDYHEFPTPGKIAIGPILLGAAKPVHVLTSSATVRAIVNMTALVVADAGAAITSFRTT